MTERSRGGLFRKRNILGGALIAGVALGVYLGQWKGFGLGGGWGLGKGQGETQVSLSSNGHPIQTLDPETETNDPLLPVPKVVRVVIDEENFLLRQANDGSKDVPITLLNLIKLIDQAPGDADGLRVRIYEKLTARAEAEENLKKELSKSGIPDAAIFWVPTPIE